jgi:hypothetical protein
MLLQPLRPEEAILVNAARPVDTSPGPAAKPLSIGKRGPFRRALECLTSAVYYEAASESLDGQRAVAQVVLNRVRHPAFPASVCAVVYQGSERRTGCQFSFTCDGSLLRPPARSYWKVAQAIAEAALGGTVYGPVGNATHYHADWVLPYWAGSLNKSAIVGRHIFYRWKGLWGQPSSFRQRYAGAERKPNLDGKLDVLVPSSDAFAETNPQKSANLVIQNNEKSQIGSEHRAISLDTEPRPALLADITAGKLIEKDEGSALGEYMASSRAAPRAAKTDANNCSTPEQPKPLRTGNSRIKAGPAPYPGC